MSEDTNVALNAVAETESPRNGQVQDGAPGQNDGRE